MIKMPLRASGAFLIKADYVCVYKYIQKKSGLKMKIFILARIKLMNLPYNKDLKIYVEIPFFLLTLKLVS